jgi:hypothetical protein
MSTTKTPRLNPVTPHAPGFNITIRPETNLGNAMLILEDEEGHYEPINLASTIDEAREIAISDSQHRGPDSLCPHVYKLFTTGNGGNQRLVAEFLASNL